MIYPSETKFAEFFSHTPTEKIPVGVETYTRGSELSYQFFATGIESLNSNIIKLLIEINNLKEATSNNIIKINDLNSGKYCLKHPIDCIFTFEGDEYLIETVDFNIYSRGATIKEAIENIKEVIIDFYISLYKNKYRLSKSLKKKFELLQNFIRQ